VVPSGEVWAGNPAKKLRDVKPSERDYLRNLPNRYIDISKEHQEVLDLMYRKMEVRHVGVLPDWECRYSCSAS
jgi:hypothetical protein